MKLFTTIKPSDLDSEWTRQCVASWSAAGFDVRFINVAGKPRINDFLNAIRESGAPFAGIINGDCKLINYPDLAANLQATLTGSAAIAWRLDVGDDVPAKAMPWGYDAFFFDTRFMPDDDLGFSIGDPWWDYWFPLALHAAGANVEVLDAPLITHRVHPFRWDQASWYAGANRLWPALRKWQSLPRLPDRERLDHAQIEILALRTPPQFRRQWPQKRVCVMPPHMRDAEEVLRLSGRMMMRRAELGNVRKVLGIGWRVFWRLTRPLMQLRGYLKVRTRAKAMARAVASVISF